MIRIIVADDQPIIRHGLRYVIGLDSELELVEEAVDGNDLLEKMRQVSCDLILMDIRMPHMDGVKATLQVKRDFPKTKVLILTTFEDEEYILRALEYGADGYLLKDADPDELIRVIKTIVQGDMFLHPKVTATVVSALKEEKNSTAREYGCEKEVDMKQVDHRPGTLMGLTDREYEIAYMIMQGNSNREIGLKLYVTEGTVKNHVTKILNKLELGNRKQLIVYMTKVIRN